MVLRRPHYHSLKSLRQTLGDSILPSALHTLPTMACYTQGSFRLCFVPVLNLPTRKVSVGVGKWEGLFLFVCFCFPIE